MTVTGLSTDDAKRVRAALVSTARTMTTLHVERDRLERGRGGLPGGAGARDRDRLPARHEHPGGGAQAGGRWCSPAAPACRWRPTAPCSRAFRSRARCPLVQGRGRPQEPTGWPTRTPLGAARIAGAAPGPLRRRLREIGHESDRGYVAQLRKGPELVFGSAAHLRAKWVAAARVLADGDTQGATYVDLTGARPPGGGRPRVRGDRAGAAHGPRPPARNRGGRRGRRHRHRPDAADPTATPEGVDARGPGRRAGAGGGPADARRHPRPTVPEDPRHRPPRPAGERSRRPLPEPPASDLARSLRPLAEGDV